MKRYALLLLFALILVFSYYFFFSKDDGETLNIKPTPLPPGIAENRQYIDALSEKDIKESVFYLLPGYAMTAQFGGKVFCANKIFGYDKAVEETSVYVYLWAYCEEYFLKSGSVKLGSGISTPVKFKLVSKDKKLVYSSIIFPGLGSDFSKSISEIFPEKYRAEASGEMDTTTMIPSPKIQAENYFSGRLEVYF